MNQLNIMSIIRSLWTWAASAAVIIIWLPLVAAVRLFDRDPVLYRTGYVFRKIGVALATVNTAWKIIVSGEKIANPRKPYVVVCNHQSMIDVPLISHLPWEMKWMGKAELFKIPIIGWMMVLSADIAVIRGDRRNSAKAFLRALWYLERKCSVMMFPEGTRSPDGRVYKFTDGAFQMALRAHVDIIPLAIEGSSDCLPKNSWKFGNPKPVLLKVLPPVSTEGMKLEDTEMLREKVRKMIIDQLAEWRNTTAEAVDGLMQGEK